MKKALMVLATLLPIAQAAIADEPIAVKGLQGVNLNIYGTMDIGLWEQSKATVNAAAVSPVSGGSWSAAHTGGISPSKLGFSGDKDMGNGVKGFFTLEEHI
ncbi:MAG: porin, partial [Rhodoferax sp.]|nr:porin [Rhodoferax sp.]